MDHPESQSSVRRYLAYVGLFGTTQLHLRNPFVIAGWSLAFPGLGHLLLSKYTRGYLLFLWEIFVNVNGHINLAILYSFTGRFQMAKDVLDRLRTSFNSSHPWCFVYYNCVYCGFPTGQNTPRYPFRFSGTV